MVYTFKQFLFLFILLNYVIWVSCVCSPQVACFPGPLDVTASTFTQSSIYVNSTCGTPKETFCSTPTRDGNTPADCSLVCDATNPLLSHPKSLMIDKFDGNTYWKSKNLEAPVTIRLDLQQKLILHQVITTFKFDVPDSVYLERSQDFGKTYKRLAYFSLQCLDKFGLTPRPTSELYSGTDTVCIAITQSDITRTISYMPRLDATIAREVTKNSLIRDHFIFTNLKFVLFDYRKPASFNKNTADPKKFFFSVKDFDVQGSCYCNGMSNQCNATNYGNCNCQKNTAGNNCEKCLPLFNNKAWEYGIACQECNCSNLARSCSYDAAKGHGVCQNCTKNTSGDFCQDCLSGFHRNANQTCVDCGCNASGVNSTGRACNQRTGVCNCKLNVQGSKCSSCKPFFWGLTASDGNGCQACGCRTAVTVNGSGLCDAITGQCACMPGFTGRTCDTCQAGYYSSQIVNPTVCTACGCNPSGSLNSSCTTSGVCFCRPLYSGTKCGIITSGYFSANVEQLLFSSLNARVISSASYTMTTSQIVNSQGTTVTVTGYSLALDAVTNSATNLVFTINLPATSGYEFILRYMTSSMFRGVTLLITRQSAFQSYSCTRDGIQETIKQNAPVSFQADLSSSNQSASFGTACLSMGQYSVRVTIPHNSSSASAKILISSLLVLPSYKYSSLYLASNITTQTSIRYYYQRAFSQASWSVHRVSGAAYLDYIFGTIFTSALACQCDATGSQVSASCDQRGGQCLCKPLVTGTRCSSCLPNAFNFTSGNGCTACGCHRLGSINESCHSLTGRCACRPNVIGNKCDRCQTNHYGINSGNGCTQCNCSQVYSTGQQCRENGSCICKAGIGGRTCSSCLPGFHGLSSSGCSVCSCNAVGSVNSICNPINASCACKQNAAGAACSRCKPGYYGFSSQFPDACLKCQCSGHTSVCSKALGFYQTSVNTSLGVSEDNLNNDGWTGINQNGLPSGRMIWNWNFFTGYSKLTNDRSESELYYSAPPKYLGNKRTSYMLKLAFSLTQQNTSRPINSSTGDVILKGNEVAFSLVTTLPEPPPQFRTFRKYEVKFDERVWRKNNTNGPIATSEDMIAVLRNLKTLLIRGKWTQANGQFSGLTLISMQQSVNTTVTSFPAYNVENCSCPVGYVGLSCERCAVGYTRAVPYGSSTVKCVPCNCNQHASTCDPVNGTCYNCQHSTTGNNCERCLTGYYGNATVGTSSYCSPCPCPGGIGASNQFSRTCVLGSDGQPTCNACQQGYSGRRCDVCSDGYSGNPTTSNGRCRRCLCSGNINSANPGNCNTTTGECLRCINNSTGFNCERCQTGFFGNAPSGTCQACSCNAVGSNNTICHPITGRCDCKSRFTVGRTCDRCAPNSFNFTSGFGCQSCNCNVFGSSSLQCLNNGSCACNARVGGDKCDSCKPGFYDITQGCLPCNCNANFTRENTTCNPITGQCECKSSRSGGSYSGRQCNQCGANAIGTPPDCALCHEPCYDNWQGYIAAETRSLANLTSKTNTLLAKFGGMSYSQIDSQLVNLNGNLTYAASVFEGAQYNTRAKEAQFKQIETSIITFEGAINQSEARLTRTEQYFAATSTFNGTVNLDSSTPTSLPSPFTNVRISTFTFNVPTTASPSSVTTMANGLLTSSRNNNVTGHIVYSTTVQNYQQIQAANRSIAQAASDIADAMKGLATAATERAKASSYISGSFQTTFQANAVELQSINTMVQSVKLLLNNTAKTHAEAKSSLSTAQATVSAAESTVNTRRTAVNAASQSASQMFISGVSLKTDATATSTSATLFKSNADAVLFDAQQTATSVATSINKVSRIRNQTNQVITTSNTVIGQTIPVSFERIQSLSNQIRATSIEENQINNTLNGATDGLKKAQDVQKLSQEAVNASQTTLDEIKGVETSLKQAESLRNATKLMQSNNTKKAAEIKNITTTVESQFQNLQGTGSQTLALVNRSITQVNSSMMCFANAKKTVDNATLLAQSAQNSSSHSLMTHQSNVQRISTTSTQINAAYVTTNKQYSELQQAKTNATQLLSDVTEAERLLAQFIAQNTELTSLQAEATSLETELDGLITKFDETSKKLSTCNRN